MYYDTHSKIMSDLCAIFVVRFDRPNIRTAGALVSRFPQQ